MMVIVLEGIVEIIPSLTQRLKRGSLFSIISKPTATLLNPKIRVLTKTTLRLRKPENDNVNVNFSCAFLFDHAQYCRVYA